VHEIYARGYSNSRCQIRDISGYPRSRNIYRHNNIRMLPGRFAGLIHVAARSARAIYAINRILRIFGSYDRSALMITSG